MKILIPIFAAWAAAWAIVIGWAPELAIVAGLGFAQNIAFTLVSRGRNSGSLTYHIVASIFSNGIWLVMFVYNVNLVTGANGFPMAFAAVYILSTMSGSVFAHWLAKRVERGAARNVQEDRITKLEEKVSEVRIRSIVCNVIGDCQSGRTPFLK